MTCVKKQLELEPVMDERYEDPRGAYDAEDWTTGPNPCYFDPSTTSSATTVSRTSPHHHTSKTLSLLYRIPAHLRTHLWRNTLPSLHRVAHLRNHLWSKLPPTNANENGNGPLPVPGGPQHRIGNDPHMRRAFDSPRSPPNNKSTAHVPCKF